MGRIRAAVLALSMVCAAGGALAAGLRVAVPAMPAVLDPHRAEAPVDLAVVSEAFMGLVALDAEGRIVPGAAERWTVGSDGLTYVFTLRGGLRWSDGAPLTARDFAESLARALDPATDAPFAALLFNIANAEGFRFGILGPGETLGVAADDPRTLRITLSRRSADFLETLLLPVAMPVPRHAMASLGAGADPVSNGAFAARRESGRTALVKNPEFFAAGQVRADGVAFSLAADAGAAMEAVRAGEAHLALGFPSQPPVRGGDAALRADGGEDLFFLAVNGVREPFSRREVRHAMAMSAPRESLIRALFLFGVSPAYSVVPESAAGYAPYKAPYMRVNDEGRDAIARALLAELDADPDAPLRGSLAYASGRPNDVSAAALADAWRAIGIDLALRPLPQAVLDRALAAGDFDVAIASWPRRGADPLPFLFPMSRAAGPWNITRYDVAAFDQNLASADAESRAERRLGYLREAEGLVIEDQIVLPMFFYPPQAMAGAALKGWRANARGIHPLRLLSVE